MNKIKLYILAEIFKSCLLIFFIFVSIAWLLQISRLISTLNNLQINLFDIFLLSLNIIPNLITTILPFIVIFGVVLAFLKLHREREILGIYSLGLSVKNLYQPLINFSIISVIFYSFSIFYIAPYFYEKFKKNEYDLRNNIIFDNLKLPNFIEVENKTIIDFDPKLNNIFISYDDKNLNNIIFAKNGLVKYSDNKYVFNLIDGFKIKVLESEIEKLEFQNYKFSIGRKFEPYKENSDSNTITLNEALMKNDYYNIMTKFSDILILVLIFYFFTLLLSNIIILNLVTYFFLFFLQLYFY